jgi:hypothetical protein
VCDGGVVIDLSGMNRVEVDAGKRVARAEAGALVRDLDQATQRFGLATTSGGCPTVGVAGLTLGGGEGLLMSKYGAACDNLISAQLVTVDGKQVEASQNSNPDLFWAIRGGGGNFGVATALEYRLHPVTDVLSGALTYPPGRIPELFQAFVKFVETAPDDMNVLGMVLPSELGPQFRLVVCYFGQPHHGNDLLSPLRSAQTAGGHCQRYVLSGNSGERWLSSSARGAFPNGPVSSGTQRRRNCDDHNGNPRCVTKHQGVHRTALRRHYAGGTE